MNNEKKRNSQKIINSILLKTGVFCIIALILIGCAPVKSSPSGSVKKFYETFYVGKEGIQYFIKPISFTNDQGHELLMDITFRHKKQVKDSAVINISLLTSEVFKNLDSVVFTNSIQRINIKEIELLFNESKGKLFVSRFTMKPLVAEVNKLFNKSSWTILIYQDKKKLTYSSSKKTRKIIQKLDNTLFAIL
ncbi:MAG: hypothetical protein ACOCWG_05350 [bacterium]